MTVSANRPDREGLFQLASEQRGYFTTTQARDYRHSRAVLAHHARTGTFQRAYTGVYRFRDYPSTPREELVAAWLALGKDVSVLSHESALDLWELGDLIPNAVHLTVPRTRRNLPRLPGVKIHTTVHALDGDDVQTLEGIRVTSPPRTLLDLADTGGAPDQISFALFQAIRRGWIDRDRIRSEAALRGRRVARIIDDAYSADFGFYQELE